MSLWVVVGLTAVLRTHALFANTFHADEALFATWARFIAAWRDPLLLTQAVDKPPLLFYLQALFYAYPVLGPTEIAGRLPNFIASIVLVPLVGVWAWRLYGDGVTAVLAALLVALSPFAIQFSATAFTDPLLTFWLVAALASGSFGLRLLDFGFRSRVRQAAASRPLLAGLLFGLAAATKYQAWLFLPLILGLGWLGGWRRRDWARFALGLLPVLALLLVWTAVRGAGFSLWSAQMGNFGGLRLVWSWELWPRLVGWLALWRWLFGSPVWSVVVVMALIRPFLNKIETQINTDEHRPPIHNSQFTIHNSQFLSLFIIAYFLLHWFLAVPIWDRYLLPLLPLVALLVARFLAEMVNGRWLTANGQRRGFIVVCSLLLVSLLFSALDGRNGRLPIGGTPQADGGAAQVAALLYDAPYGAVLYDHWYSWQWEYHLFWRRVFVNWVPYPDALAEDLRVFGGDGSPRYLVLPLDQRALPFQRAVAAAGFRLAAIDAPQPTAMQLYRIERETMSDER
ncbi:MAG: phospholipid carrier-dependent glycosyltransferase [Chloroflexi bacterium]|nr:phospholipid carrier-dependent glycosyltransferase [Chloroflexota bacterium]